MGISQGLTQIYALVAQISSILKDCTLYAGQKKSICNCSMMKTGYLHEEANTKK